MDWNDENSSAMMKPSNLRGANRDRKPLRDKNEFVGAPPLPPGDNKKVYPCILKETAVRRPTTRQFSALLANQRNGPQGLNQCHEDKENIHRPIDLNVPTNIEIMDVESDMEIDPCSHAIRYTEAILNEDNCDKEKNHGDGEVDEDIDGSMDIDQLDFGNPLAVVDYVEEIYDFYRQTERSCCPSYMSHQPDINERMRAILVDWLIEVHYKFKLMDETLFRTVSIIDRFLQCQAVTRKQLQLVGITALLVACKYEEVYVPVIDDFIMISDNAYTREQILEMEKLIINKLEFSFSEPTAYVFMRRFLKAAQSEKELEYLSFYLIELSLIEYEMLKYKPSMLAAAAIYTAQCILKGFRCWSRASEHHTYYSERDLIDSARMMVDLQKAADLGKLTGAYRKYNTPKFGFASRTIPASFLLDALF